MLFDWFQGKIVPARRDRHGVVEDETRTTRRGHPNDPVEAPPDDASHPGSSEDPVDAPSHYDEPTRLVRRRKADSRPGDGETTILRSRRTQDAAPVPEDETDDPVTGWLVIVDGPGKGRSLTLGAGRNAIGRGATANVKLDFGDREVSRSAHAYITYDDEARLWYIQQGGGRNLVRVEGRPVLEPMPIQSYSDIRIGRTRLVFVPFCGEDFDWEQVGTEE